MSKRNKKGWLSRLRKRISHSEIFMEILAAFAALVIKVYSWTLRPTFYIHPELEKIDRSKVLFGFWEGRQLMFIPYFGDWKISVLIDASWVGKVLVKILRWFGIKTVVGSAKRKGVSAMLNLKKELDKGYASTFSLDGPRGPIHKSKPGIIFLSEKTGYPIVPGATSANRAWVLKSTWCHYMIPKPFAKCYLAVGKPVYDGTKKGGMTTEDVDRIVLDLTEKVDREVKEL